MHSEVSLSVSLPSANFSYMSYGVCKEQGKSLIDQVSVSHFSLLQVTC